MCIRDSPCAGIVRILLCFGFLRFPGRRSKRSFPVPGRQWLMQQARRRDKTAGRMGFGSARSGLFDRSGRRVQASSGLSISKERNARDMAPAENRRRFCRSQYSVCRLRGWVPLGKNGRRCPKGTAGFGGRKGFVKKKGGRFRKTSVSMMPGECSRGRAGLRGDR